MKDYFMITTTYSTGRTTASTTTVIEADNEREARMIVMADMKVRYSNVQITDVKRTSKLMYNIGLYMDHKIDQVDPALFPTVKEQGEVA